MTPFDRYRPALAALHMATLQMALGMAAIASWGLNPMPPLVYGDEAARVNALVWAGMQAGASALTIWGCIHRRRAAVIIGSGALGVLFVLLAAAGFSALPEGSAVALMSSGAAPLCFVTAWLAWRRSDA